MFDHQKKDILNQPSFYENAKQYGNKAANLLALATELQMLKVNAKIPEICPLSHVILWEHLIAQCGKQWQTLWEQFQAEQSQQNHLSEKASTLLSELRSLIQTSFTRELIEKNEPLKKSLDEFIQGMQGKTLMVRSTGDEDSVDVANPGGNESIPNVAPNLDSITSAIGKVVASYLSEKSLTQRLLSAQNEITKMVFMPVLLQHMVSEPQWTQKEENQEADLIVRSGVMYTHTQRGMTCIQAAPGHGDLVVNSKAPFDTYLVTRENMVYAKVEKKSCRLVPKAQGLSMHDNTKELMEQPALTEDVALRLATLGRTIELHYGMPMDVEFVYHPKEDMIYVVQARPIPTANLNMMTPSSIPPEKIPAIKEMMQNKTIDVAKGEIITTAGYTVKLITATHQLLIFDTIEQALTHYLHQHNAYVRAVIVKNKSPSTSHPAAQFNTQAIPVLQLDCLETINAWVKEKNFVLMVDPQRNQIINWTNILKNSTDPQHELEKEGLLKTGFFTSPVSPTTPSQRFFQKTTSDTLQETSTEDTLGDLIRKKQNKEEKDNSLLKLLYAKIKDLKSSTNKNKIYTQLLDSIETIEAATIKNTNRNAIEALEAIRFIFTKLANQEENKINFYSDVMVICEEIARAIKKYSALTEESLPAREELLALTAVLKSFVMTPGNESVFSNSLLQALQEKKSVISALKILTDKQALTSQQLDYFTQFIKLSKVALSENTKKKWADFVLDCSKDDNKIQALSHIIRFFIQNQLESDLVNGIFNDSNATSDILETMNKEYLTIEKELLSVHFHQRKTLIRKWERRISEWSEVNKFDPLLTEFKYELTPLLADLGITDPIDTHSGALHPVTQKALLKMIQQLTEVMDFSIKSMKGSVEYRHDRNLQNYRFGQILEPYHTLMQRYLNTLSDKRYQQWASLISISEGNSKTGMLAAIEKTFQACQLKKSNQLQASSYLNVDSVIVGTTASFTRQFINKSEQYTLEDLFSLMHQNLLASTVILGESTQIKKTYLPTSLVSLLTALETIQNSQLLSIEHHYPLVRLNYNLPLRNHSGKLTFEYNQLTHQIVFHHFLFGHDGDNRMSDINNIAKLEGRLFQFNVKKEPSYSLSEQALTFSWELNANQLSEEYYKKIADLVTCYAQYTLSDLRYREVQLFLSVFRRHHEALSRNNEALVKKEFMNKLVKRSSDIDCFILIMEELPETAKNDIFASAMEKVVRSITTLESRALNAIKNCLSQEKYAIFVERVLKNLISSLSESQQYASSQFGTYRQPRCLQDEFTEDLKRIINLVAKEEDDEMLNRFIKVAIECMYESNYSDLLHALKELLSKEKYNLFIEQSMEKLVDMMSKAWSPVDILTTVAECYPDDKLSLFIDLIMNKLDKIINRMSEYNYEKLLTTTKKYLPKERYTLFIKTFTEQFANKNISLTLLIIKEHFAEEKLTISSTLANKLVNAIHEYNFEGTLKTIKTYLTKDDYEQWIDSLLIEKLVNITNSDNIDSMLSLIIPMLPQEKCDMFFDSVSVKLAHPLTKYHEEIVLNTIKKYFPEKVDVFMSMVQKNKDENNPIFLTSFRPHS